MDQWKVLPTDPRYQDLTSEQRSFMWEHFLLDHPEIQKQLSSEDKIYDPDFDAEWEALETKETPIDEEIENIDEIEDNFKRFIEEIEGSDWEEIN